MALFRGVRETACDAFQAWMDWDGKSPEPTAEYQIHYVPHHISISRACGLVWNCTDIVPGSLFDDAVTSGLTRIPDSSRTSRRVGNVPTSDMRLAGSYPIGLTELEGFGRSLENACVLKDRADYWPS
jgi:hypothetical protein